jgi:hypothetical protein
VAERTSNRTKNAKKGHGAAMPENTRRGSSAVARKAGGGSGDPGRHTARAQSPASTRKVRSAIRSGTTTAGKTAKAGSGGMASSMKNKQVMPPRATAAAEGGATRKSTRRGANRAKGATQLTARTKRAVRSPKARAARAAVARGR